MRHNRAGCYIGCRANNVLIFYKGKFRERPLGGREHKGRKETLKKRGSKGAVGHFFVGARENAVQDSRDWVEQLVAHRNIQKKKRRGKHDNGCYSCGERRQGGGTLIGAMVLNLKLFVQPSSNEERFWNTGLF